MRIHTSGLCGYTGSRSEAWTRKEEMEAMRQQGGNRKRAVMVWALSKTDEPKMGE